MAIDRRSFLRLMLAAPIAATVDVEKLLWVPKPIITVPADYGIWVGAINKASFTFWRNQQVSDLLEHKIYTLKETVLRELNRDLFSDGKKIEGLQLIVAGNEVKGLTRLDGVSDFDWTDPDDDPDY